MSQVEAYLMALYKFGTEPVANQKPQGIGQKEKTHPYKVDLATFVQRDEQRMGTESWADDVREAQTIPTLAPHLLFIHTGLLNNFAIDIKSIQSYNKNQSYRQIIPTPSMICWGMCDSFTSVVVEQMQLLSMYSIGSLVDSR